MPNGMLQIRRAGVEKKVSEGDCLSINHDERGRFPEFHSNDQKKFGSEKFRVKWISEVRLTSRFGWEHGSIASGLLPPRGKSFQIEKKSV